MSWRLPVLPPRRGDLAVIADVAAGSARDPRPAAPPVVIRVAAEEIPPAADTLLAHDLLARGRDAYLRAQALRREAAPEVAHVGVEA